MKYSKNLLKKFVDNDFHILAIDIGMLNLAICFRHKDNTTVSLLHSVAHKSHHTLRTRIHKFLDTLRLNKFTIVVTENQHPHALKNLKIQEAIESYFHNKENKLLFTRSARNKTSETLLRYLREHNIPITCQKLFERIPKVKHKSPVYKRITVALSKDIAAYFKDYEFLTTLDTHKKKDDLADAYIMTVYEMFLIGYDNFIIPKKIDEYFEIITPKELRKFGINKFVLKEACKLLSNGKYIFTGDMHEFKNFYLITILGGEKHCRFHLNHIKQLVYGITFWVSSKEECRKVSEILLINCNIILDIEPTECTLCFEETYARTKCLCDTAYCTECYIEYGYEDHFSC